MKWSTVADHITGMIVLHEWLSPDEAVLPSVNEQLSLIGEAESKKDSAFDQLCAKSREDKGKIFGGTSFASCN